MQLKLYLKKYLVDVAFVGYVVNVLLCYDYQKNLTPESYLIIILLGCTWFIARLFLSFYPKFTHCLVYVILLTGAVEAFWGLGQLYGWLPLKHVIFKTTGSFLNPGPYGGFIALMFPMVLHDGLYSNKNKILRYIILFIGVSCILVFPSTLSRTAWIAAFIGCFFVFLFHTEAVNLLQSFSKIKPKKKTLYLLVSLAIVITLAYVFYNLKKDSADGRFFMWKITSEAIKESPVKGVGLGGFPAAYSKAQTTYFKNGHASATEEMVAGSPEYAFNEYLQIFLEQGLLGISLFLVITFLIVKKGIKNKHIGVTGSFITLSVFAFASYPYRLWEFPFVWIMFGVICITPVENENHTVTKHFDKRHTLGRIFMLMLFISLSIACLIKLQMYNAAKHQWRELQTYYSMKSFHNILDDYTKLYPLLNSNPNFVFEYGQILNATKQYAKADIIFNRGLDLSCDPMFYNVKGRNYHEMKNYQKAEDCYMKSINLLPGRIYPYYLLTKLYADSAYYHPDKMKKTAFQVLKKEPKIRSTAINEMRDEVKKILKKNPDEE